MTTYETEALDIIETKIRELETKVYGEKQSPTENFNPVTESLIQTNTLMVAALSGRERISSVFKRLNELNEYLSPGYEDQCLDVNTKLNIILSMEDELKNNVDALQKIEKYKQTLNDPEFHNIAQLQSELNGLVDHQMEKKQKLNEITSEVQELLTKFNDTCVEISKSFVCLNDAITKLEQERLPKKKTDY